MHSYLHRNTSNTQPSIVENEDDIASDIHQNCKHLNHRSRTKQ